jgi:outer membrane protein OmpA-like peptidoglycan-associated protein
MARTFLRVLCLVVVLSLTPPVLVAQAKKTAKGAAKTAAEEQGGGSAKKKPTATKKPSKTKARPTSSLASSDEPLNPQPSLWGYPGLWKTVGAGGLPARSFGGTGWVDRINRNPGYLTITTFGTSGFYSFSQRFALDYQVNINRRVLVRRADQLSFGQQRLTLFGKGGCPEPNCFPTYLLPTVTFPGQLIPYLRDPHTGVLLNTAGFYNGAPWASALSQNGLGEVVLGGHVTLLDFSDSRKFAVGLRPYVFIPTRRGLKQLQESGAQTGSFQYGADLLLEGRAGKAAGLYANAGFRHVTDPKPGGQRQFGLYNTVPVSFGVNIPRTGRLQLLAEYTAGFFFGRGTPDDGLGTATDGTVGFRAYPVNWLAFSAGYRHTLNHSQYGGDKNGFVGQLSVSYLPVPTVQAPIPPTVSCAAEGAAVLAGEPVRLTATASTTSGGTLTYTWATTAGRIEGAGPTARLNTTGLAPGSYAVTVRVDDGRGGFADCTTQVSVKSPPPPPPPPKPPTATCGADKSSVAPGEVVALSATATSPDNRRLNYDWTVTGGRVAGSGPAVRWDTTGLSTGAYTATVRVADDRGLSARCSAAINVQAPPPAPRAARLNECKFKAGSPRVDNVCKAVLDDVALRLQNEPGSRAALIGSHTAKEARTKALQSLNVQRASNVKAYLVREKGINTGRIDVRTIGDSETVQIWLLPRGASMADLPGAAAIEQMPPEKKVPRKAAPRKKAAATTEAAPVKKAAPVTEAAPAKKAAPAAKAAPAKKAGKKAPTTKTP